MGANAVVTANELERSLPQMWRKSYATRMSVESLRHHRLCRCSVSTTAALFAAAHVDASFDGIDRAVVERRDHRQLLRIEQSVCDLGIIP